MNQHVHLISQEWIDDFFSPLNSEGILKRREGQTIEFKLTFEWNSNEWKAAYLKTIAAFANSKGGYLIFGIDKKPHKLVGCSGFDNVDVAHIVDSIQKYFHCDIPVEKELAIINGKEIGIIAVHECPGKPVICIKDGQNSKNQFVLREGLIYYRYAGKSSEIKSGDLINLIEGAKEKINQKWISTLSHITSAGISNIGVVNTATGLLNLSNSSFLISEEILKDIKVIDKYSEKSDGEPGIRIIGTLDGSARVIKQNRTIEEFEVIQEFLERKGNFEYQSILERIPNFPSFAYPFFYFLNRCGQTREDLINQLISKPKFSEETPFIKKMLKDYRGWITKRKQSAPLSQLGPKAKSRMIYFEQIKNGEDYSCGDNKNDIIFCEALLHLEKEDFNSQRSREYLLDIFKNNYNTTSVAKAIREACCAIDILEFE